MTNKKDDKSRTNKSTAFDFLFENQNKQYDEEYKDYIEDICFEGRLSKLESQMEMIQQNLNEKDSLIEHLIAVTTRLQEMSRNKGDSHSPSNSLTE